MFPILQKTRVRIAEAELLLRDARRIGYDSVKLKSAERRLRQLRDYPESVLPVADFDKAASVVIEQFANDTKTQLQRAEVELQLTSSSPQLKRALNDVLSAPVKKANTTTSPSHASRRTEAAAAKEAGSVNMVDKLRARRMAWNVKQVLAAAERRSKWHARAESVLDAEFQIE